MNLSMLHVDAIADALAKLRRGARAFVAAKDRAVVFGKNAPATLMLPDSTQKADCVVWIQELDEAALLRVADHLVGLSDELRSSIRAEVRFQRVFRTGTLAALGAPLVVNRSKLLFNMSELRTGTKRMLRVWGERGSGKTFTATVVEELLGAPAGSDQRVITIDLSSYADDAMLRATNDIVGVGVALPDRGSVADKKYPETLALFVIRRLIETSTAVRVWLVIDRCRIAEEGTELGSFLKYVAASVTKFQANSRCPRVVFLEANKELLGRYRKDMMEEELDEIDEVAIREFCVAREKDPVKQAAAVAKVAAAIAGKKGGERLELIQATLEGEFS